MIHVCDRGPCDHCQPEAWHACARPAGHRGHHSCEPEPGDLLWPEPGDLL